MLVAGDARSADAEGLQAAGLSMSIGHRCRATNRRCRHRSGAQCGEVRRAGKREGGAEGLVDDTRGTSRDVADAGDAERDGMARSRTRARASRARGRGLGYSTSFTVQDMG